MTNGLPIIIRAAMKPIPTLTTPLILGRTARAHADQGPFRTERRLRGSCGARGRRGHGRLRAGRALPREVRGRQPRRLRSRLWPPTKRASKAGDCGAARDPRRLHGLRQVVCRQTGGRSARLGFRGPRRSLRIRGGHCHRRLLRRARGAGLPPAGVRTAGEDPAQERTPTRGSCWRWGVEPWKPRRPASWWWAEAVWSTSRSTSEQAWQRARGTERPLAADEQQFRALLARRRTVYESAAELDTAGRTPQRRASEPRDR